MTTEAQRLPNRLIIEAGVLKMKDGSDVVEYLKTREYLEGHDVVVLRRQDAVRLIDGYRSSLPWSSIPSTRGDIQRSAITTIVPAVRVCDDTFGDADWYRFWLAS